MISKLGLVQPERLRADLALLLAAVIWGSAFAAQRVAAGHFDAFLFNSLRFLLGAAVLLPLARRAWSGLDRRAAWGAGLAGALLFGGAAFQQLGLAFTTAGNAGFITGLYVVLIPLILAVGWRQMPRPAALLAALMASGGLFLLSTGGRLAAPAGGHAALGDTLELAGAVLFAAHVIWIGRLVHQAPVLPLAIVQYLVCGALNALVAGFNPAPAALGWAALLPAGWTIVYTGVFSIALGYTLQAVGQRAAPPADAAILLSAEALFAAVFGWLLLGERLAGPQWAGGGLILAGMLLSQAGALSANGRRSLLRPARKNHRSPVEK